MAESMEVFLDNLDKSKTYLNINLASNADVALILIHGLAEHSGRYTEFIKNITQNISVFAMDIRGHGKSVGKRGDSQSIKKVLDDVDRVYNYISSNYKFKKIGIFGHSVGGLIASLYAGQNRGVNFLVLSSPLVYLPKKLKILRFLPCKMLPFVKLKKHHSESNEMLNFSRNDPLSLKKISLRTFGVFFCDGLKRLNNVKIQCPTLLMIGKGDPLLSERTEFEIFFEKIDNKTKNFVCYEESKHRIVQNANADKHTNDIIHWINSIVIRRDYEL